MARERDLDRAFETSETDYLAWPERIQAKLGVTLGQVLLAIGLILCLLGCLGYFIYSVKGVPYFAKQHLQLEKGQEPHHWTYPEFESSSSIPTSTRLWEIQLRRLAGGLVRLKLIHQQ